jgi:hypothetical protein
MDFEEIDRRRAERGKPPLADLAAGSSAVLALSRAPLKVARFGLAALSLARLGRQMAEAMAEHPRAIARARLAWAREQARAIRAKLAAALVRIGIPLRRIHAIDRATPLATTVSQLVPRSSETTWQQVACLDHAGAPPIRSRSQSLEVAAI